MFGDKALEQPQKTEAYKVFSWKTQDRLKGKIHRHEGIRPATYDHQPKKRCRSLTDLVSQPSLKQSKMEDFILTQPPCLESPAPFLLAPADHGDPLMTEGVAPRVETKDAPKATVPNQLPNVPTPNVPTLMELLAQQCFLVAETTASIQLRLDQIISTLNYLVSLGGSGSGSAGLAFWRPGAVVGAPVSSLSKSFAQCNTNSTFLDANSHLVLQPNQVALNINPINGYLPRWGSIRLARGHILQLLGLEADDLKRVDLLASSTYCTRVLLSFVNSNTPKLFFRRRSLLRSFGILPRRVFKDISIKPLLSNRSPVCVWRCTAL